LSSFSFKGEILSKIIIEDENISGISVLKLYESDLNRKVPLIIIFHGFLGRKEKNLEQAYILAIEGFFVIIYDLFMHGEQETEDFRKSDYGDKVGKIFDIHSETTKYIDILIKAFENSELVDTKRTGLMGFSIGGNIVFNYISKFLNNNIKAAIPVLATPFWERPLREYIAENSMAEKYFDESKILLIRKIQPYNGLKKLRDFPLFIINGEIDNIVPIDEMRKLYEELKHNYNNSENLKFSEYKGVGHQVTKEMFMQSALWFKKYL